MSERERVREEASHIIREWYLRKVQTLTDCVTEILAIEGVHIAEKDQSLPQYKHSGCGEDWIEAGRYQEAQQDMLKAGFVKVVSHD